MFAQFLTLLSSNSYFAHHLHALTGRCVPFSATWRADILRGDLPCEDLVSLLYRLNVTSDADIQSLFEPGSNGSHALAQQRLRCLRRVAELHQLQRTIYLITVPVMIFFCSVAAIINLTISLSARLVRRPLSPTMCFSISLAGADAYAASILGIGLLFNSLLPVGFQVETWHDCLSLAFEALRLAGIISTAAHLLALAFNHYIGILRPLHYATLITRGRVLTAIIFLWGVPILFFFLYFLAAGGFLSSECPITFLQRSTFRRVVATLFFIPLVCMFFTYSHIFVIIRRQQKGFRASHNSTQLKGNVKAIVTTLLILGTYVIGWMPGLISYILICSDCAFQGEDFTVESRLSMNVTANTLIILKCLVDPVIYAARMPEIQLALRRLRHLVCCRTGSPPPLTPRQTTYPVTSHRGQSTADTSLRSHLTIRSSTVRQNGHMVIPLRSLKHGERRTDC